MNGAHHHDLDRLINLLRDSDSATRTLAAWISHPIHLEMVSRRDDRLAPAEFVDLDVREPERVQRRQVRLLGGRNQVLSEATATVLLGRVPYLAACALRDTDIPLGAVLAPLEMRRHTLRVIRREQGADWNADVLFSIEARLDLGGRPVAMVHERYLPGVLP